ncbi:HNH endonuclease [Chlorobaculum parvum NCIB 8327]|uniref:HNH endonuclease n=1 Tax=Chlorobaculum parvum (strain DSM 263 / NCIMB 8327) TaxID=517417 RepID=B3QND6_CHLP8|nr:HNH endonuclease signature motif containing protein [Chlorobaculum parvum]ACF11439.1 HNH endonuclease [Chlorobaculum parvum NCIB 8327]
MSKKTFNALISRGFDSQLANSIISKGLTLTKLKQSDSKALEKLGIDRLKIESILKEQRPPIPIDTVIKLLYESKRVCCICRDKDRSVVIHHIKEWHLSKDHSEDNLVVLCLEHHNDAHTKKGQSLSLTERQIIEAKKEWIKTVKCVDALTILGLSSHDGGRWDYFNHNRIFEMFLDKSLSNTDYKTTHRVQELGLINEIGTFSVKDSEKTQFYNFGDGHILYYYMKELFNDVLKTIPLIDITDKFNKEDIRALLTPGKFIAFQGGFYFKDLSSSNEGKNQRRLCYYKKDGVKLEFEFDAYEATSNSAWGTHLQGKKVVTPICFVKSVVEEKGEIIIGLSCLAIGSYFLEHQYRQNDDNLQLIKAKFSSYFDEDVDDL